jgi:hypothetical protein
MNASNIKGFICVRNVAMMWNIRNASIILVGKSCHSALYLHGLTKKNRAKISSTSLNTDC